MQVLQEEHYFYILEYDEITGDYFLEALCGTVGVFTVKIKLTAKEIADYQANNESVRILAQKIVYSPESFLPRRV